MKNQPVHLLVIFSAFLFATTQAQGQITFNLEFEDVTNSTGVGFDDPTLGAARRNTVTAVTNYLNTVFDANGTVDIRFDNSQTDGSGFLAAAGPNFFTGPNGFQNGFAFDHATTGSDPFPGEPDATAIFDFGFNYNSELDDPTSSEFDLFTVTLHELTHTLGFVSLLESDGTSGISGGDPGVFSVFDSLLTRGDGTALFGPDGDFIGTAADLTSGDVFFSGANAIAANGGNPVEIFAPGTFQDGSSLSHLDGAIFPDAVSQPSIAAGVSRREFLDVEIGLFQDLGFSIVAVPEPSALAVIFLISGVTFVRRRKRHL